MNVLILYEEVAGYFLACVNKFVEKFDAKVHIFRKEVNREAPFNFDERHNLFFHTTNDYSFLRLEKFVNDFNPGAILCGGWSNQQYLKICRKNVKRIPVVLGFDNKWENTWKQNIASLLSPFILKNHFNICWVPGSRQFEFAKKLGFSDDAIYKNAYAADFDLFYSHYLSNLEQKKNSFPKRFIYTARYVKHKGIADLWRAFAELQSELPNEWELWCLGTGDVPPLNHPKIKHFGFIQPAALAEYLRQTGVFVLPSRFEPWGVAVHEFAAAGFPLICSKEVGSVELFLEDGKNGFLFSAGNVSELKNCLKRIINSPENDLIKMSAISVEKAKQITPDQWADTFFKILTCSRKRVTGKDTC